MVVDLGYGAVCVCGYGGGAQLDRAPRIDEPTVGIVEGFDAPSGEGGAGEEYGSGPGERFDVAARVAERGPDDRRGSAFAAEVGEGCAQVAHDSTHSIRVPSQRTPR